MASKRLTECWREAMAAKPSTCKLMGVACGPHDALLSSARLRQSGRGSDPQDALLALTVELKKLSSASGCRFPLALFVVFTYGDKCRTQGGPFVSRYLLSTYMVEGQVPGGPQTPEEMRGFMERVAAVEAEMDAQRAFVFGGALSGPEDATVFRPKADGSVMTTDGPFVESKEHIGGFYIIDAEDDAVASEWAGKVAQATNHAIEARPFRATGRIDQHR